MKHILIIVLLIFFMGCQRKRKVNIEGDVIDAYTGSHVTNVTVKLYSQIGEGVSGGTFNTYEQVTDDNGHFSFKNAVFSKPGNSGYLTIIDANYEDASLNTNTQEESIKGSEIKFIGKTKLTKGIDVICISPLNAVLNISPTIDFSYATFYLKFTGVANTPYDNFKEIGTWKKTPGQYDHLPNKLIGYSNGINILQTNYFDALSQSLKTRYDTIVSQGYGSVNNYTINLN